jgi:hypothetical protein
VNAGQLDLPRIGVASVVAAALALGFAVAFLHRAQSTAHVGPTSATLDDAFSLFAGAALGLAVGGAVGALLVRRGSRVLAGLLVGLVVYVLVLAPVFVVTDDVSLGEDFGSGGLAFLALLAVPLGALAVLGGIVGDLLARLRPDGGRFKA